MAEEEVRLSTRLQDEEEDEAEEDGHTSEGSRPVQDGHSPLRRGMSGSNRRPLFLGLANAMGDWREHLPNMYNLPALNCERTTESGQDEDSEEEQEIDEEDASIVDEEEDSSEFEFRHPCGGVISGGIRNWNPDFYRWLVIGIGGQSRIVMLFLFIGIDAVRFVQSEEAYQEEVNVFSVLVVANAVSLCVAFVTSIFVEGAWALDKIFSWHPVWRFWAISALFTGAAILSIHAFRLGMPAVDVALLGYLYLPITAWMSHRIYRREYSRLEWLSIGMIVLSAACYGILRERKKAESVLWGHFSLTEGLTAAGFGVLLASIVTSAMASILAERIFKDKSIGLIRRRGVRNDRFYITKVHLDFGQLMMSMLLWLLATGIGSSMTGLEGTESWFGNWSHQTVLMVAIMVAQSWLAGIVAKHFSTVVKSLAQTVATVTALLLFDKIMHRYYFEEREIPSIMLAIIVVLSGIIFQTGRLNVSVIKKRLHLNKKPDNFQPPGTPLGIFRALFCPFPKEETAVSPVSTTSQVSEKLSPAAQVRRYTSMVLYILADAARNLLTARANSTYITPQSMPVMTFAFGVGLFSGIILCSKEHGPAGLKQAWRIGKVIKCLPCGFFFALATAMLSMAFSQGVSASMNMILGKIYTPMAALASRWILGKKYMWLEWFALVITTLASVVFGYLQTMHGSHSHEPTPVFPMVLVVCSALASVLGSLTVERILKGEGSPFIITKVRLDLASLFWSLALLPALGGFSHLTAPLGHSRQQDAFWTDRPLGMAVGACSDPNCLGVLGSNRTCGTELCHCACGSGILVAWDALAPPGTSAALKGVRVPIVLMALAANVFQGYLSAMVAYQFSTVQRAIADSFSLLMVYFLGDPLLNGACISDPALNLVAFIVPLSAATFMAAAHELQRLLVLAGLDIRSSKPRRKEEAGSEATLSGSESASDAVE